MSQPFETELLADGNALPLVVSPSDPGRRARKDLVKLIKGHRDWIETKVLEHGGILLRGYAIDTPKDFEKVAGTVLPKLKPYVEGQSPRSRVRGNVYTSTEYPKQHHITLHSELSYTKEPPRKLLFYCEIPADKGGETPIVDCRKVYEQMPAELRDKFESLGVRYVKHMPSDDKGLGKSWMETFETHDRKKVERHLSENEMTWEWLESGLLRTEANRPSIRKHPATNETVWYNQANLWHVTDQDEQRRKTLLQICGEERLPTHCFFGDGSPISEEELGTVRRVLWDNAVIFPWQQGDVLVLDNLLSAHGRMPFDGPRKVLVGMG